MAGSPHRVNQSWIRHQEQQRRKWTKRELDPQYPPTSVSFCHASIRSPRWRVFSPLPALSTELSISHLDKDFDSRDKGMLGISSRFRRSNTQAYVSNSGGNLTERLPQCWSFFITEVCAPHGNLSIIPVLPWVRP